MVIDSNNIKNIVLIADRTYYNDDDINIDSNNLEMITDDYFEDVYNGLSSFAENVFHYNDLKSFINNIRQHEDDIVFTIYGGKNSRNRLALVPAICESYKVKYVGADVYARIICQDKHLAKEYCNQFGIKCNKSYVINTSAEIPIIKNLRLPFVIKPNMEGSSIGINKNSLIRNYENGAMVLTQLLNKIQQPILAEEFAYGAEVCVCITGSKHDIELFEVMEVYNPQMDAYLYDKLYDAEEKHLNYANFKHRPITDKLSKRDTTSLKSIFHSLGKLDYFRVDGRLFNGEFTLIELTPDAYIGKTSSISDAYQSHKISYNQMLKNIISNSLSHF